jgi:hypothetical protein
MDSPVGLISVSGTYYFVKPDASLMILGHYPRLLGRLRSDVMLK